MNIHEEYQRENEFSEDEKIYYILTGEGGAAMISKKVQSNYRAKIYMLKTRPQKQFEDISISKSRTSNA